MPFTGHCYCKENTLDDISREEERRPEELVAAGSAKFVVEKQEEQASACGVK